MHEDRQSPLSRRARERKQAEQKSPPPHEVIGALMNALLLRQAIEHAAQRGYAQGHAHGHAAGQRHAALIGIGILHQVAQKKSEAR